jgi:multiple sugar transport system substrate-binding protein
MIWLIENKGGGKSMASWQKGIFGATVSAVLAASLVAGCGSSQNAASNNASATNGKPFAGKTLNLVVANHPWADSIKQLIPEFESETGMKVNVTSYFEDQLSQKLSVSLTAGSSTPDVFMYRPLQEGKLFFKNGWLQPLNDYVTKDANWNWNDFTDSARGTVTFDGKITGIPIITEQEIMYYRKDLLEKAGLQPPKTIDELVADVAKLNDPSHGVYGFVARGQRSAAVTQESSFLYSFGGDWAKDGKATVNSPEAVKAFTTYGDLLKKYGPPGVLNMSWPQAAAIFAQGKAAFYTDADSIFSNVSDPSKSTVADKVGYAVFPAGTAGAQHYNVTSWGLAVNKNSKNLDAAFEFVKWATSEKVVAETQAKGNPGARQSVWNSADALKGFPADLGPVIKESAKSGVDHDRPTVVDVGQARDIVGNIAQAAIAGQDVKAAADKAEQDFQALLDKESK